MALQPETHPLSLPKQPASLSAPSLSNNPNDLYAAWKEYRQASKMLSGLADNAALRTRAEALEKDKAIRDGAKREKQEFNDQEEFTRTIYEAERTLAPEEGVLCATSVGLQPWQSCLQRLPQPKNSLHRKCGSTLRHRASVKLS